LNEARQLIKLIFFPYDCFLNSHTQIYYLHEIFLKSEIFVY